MRHNIGKISLLTLFSSLTLMAVEIDPEFMGVSQPNIIVDDVDEYIDYDGFYVGASLSHTTMNEAVTADGYNLTFITGYYFNKYFGVEGRYSRSVIDIDIDEGAEIISSNDVLENIGIYLKPMYNLTTGFSFYGLLGYGKTYYEKFNKTYSEDGFQWGGGAKYELAEGFGIFIDYTNLYHDDSFDSIKIKDINYDTINVGVTYLF